jgi:hypothetical protein
VPTDSSAVVNIPNAIKITGPISFMFARRQINGSYELGTVHENNGVYVFQSFFANSQAQSANTFEILTCFYPCCSCKLN